MHLMLLVYPASKDTKYVVTWVFANGGSKVIFKYLAIAIWTIKQTASHNIEQAILWELLSYAVPFIPHAFWHWDEIVLKFIVDISSNTMINATRNTR